MFAAHYHPQFADPSGSPIRELFPYLSQPDLISLAGGYPSTHLFDAEGLREAAARALSDAGLALQYGATEGLPLLKKALLALCAQRGIAAEPVQMLVTTGSQQAFDLLLRVFIQPGDVVCIETPAYPAAIQALRLAGAVMRELPVDADGLDVEWLRALLKDSPAHEHPKLLYTVPNYSNPSGTLLSATRRQALVELAVEYGFLVIEDDPYGELRFTDERPQALYALGTQLAGRGNPVIYLSSLSKTVAPALRIGWMVADQQVVRRCAIAKQTCDLCSSPLNQLIAAHYLDSGRLDASVEAARQEYRHRMETLCASLTQRLGERVVFVRPQGGMFLWLEGRMPFDPKALFAAAVQEGVLFVPGAAFYPSASQTPIQAMRLSFAAPDAAAIEEAVARLARAFDTAWV